MSQMHHANFSRSLLKSIIFGGLGSGIGLLGIMFSVALYVVETLIRPKPKPAKFEEYSFTPYELGLPAEVVAFSPLHGDYKVSGWYIPCPQATSTILVCPGYRSRKTDVLGICGQLWKAGHNVLAFEYYGHGTFVGKSITLGYREVNDFLGAVAYAKERAPQTRLGVLAYSMGAAVAIMSCARINDVEAVIADSSFATHWSAVDYNIRRILPLPSAPFVWIADHLMGWRAGYRFHQVEPLRDIGKISPRPILIIQSGKDTIVDPRDGALLYGAAKEPKELWIIPEADHCGAYFADRDAYVKRVIDFFALHLQDAHPRLQLVEAPAVEQTDINNTSVRNLPEAS
jgi:fermentation-respiration switch protein FrsA (DUF1100 family)